MAAERFSPYLVRSTVDAIEHYPLWLLSSMEHGQLMAQCDDLGLQ